MSGIALQLRKYWGSGFVRSVAVLSGGNGIALVVPILAAPVLGRLYLPADYGVLAQYMALAAVLSVLASLQFQHAIIAERSDIGAAKAAWLVLLLSSAMAGLTALAVLILWEPLFSESAPGPWFAFLPLGVAGAGVIASGQFLANRHRRYRFIASVQISNVVATVLLSLILGFRGWGANGLLSAYFLGQLVQVCSYIWLLREPDTLLFPLPGVARLKVLVRRHWKFPVFTLPSEFSGQLNMQAPIFALGAMGADATLGAFTRARQLVSMPATVVGSSVAQVFRREAAELYRATGSCRDLMSRTAGWLFAVGIVPCLAFMAFAPWLFEIYLGPNWREAGEIARILAPMLMLRVIVSPLTTVFFFTGNQALDLKLMLGSSAMMAVAIGIGWAISGTAISIVWAFSGGYAAIYVIYMIAAFKVAGP